MMKILVILGTRPEAIKLAPVIAELKKNSVDFQTVVCVTGQHREMLDQVLEPFGIAPDYDINVMSPNQDLFDVTGKMLSGLREIVRNEGTDLVLIQGDTTTAFVASLAAFYFKTAIGHVEAGLRTNNKYQPFPEEKNRQMVSVLADFHFAPTQWAKQNLLREGIPERRVWITGNTGIDALLWTMVKLKEKGAEDHWRKKFLDRWNLDFAWSGNERRLILVTGHRRENFGKGLENICLALREIACRNKDAVIVYPVHLNPNVRRPVFDMLHNHRKGQKGDNIYLLEPLEYAPFVYLMAKSYIILTDSGGVQEEAPSLGKPVLVMRDTTERPEGIEAGILRLVGTRTENIVKEAQKLLDDPNHYRQMSNPVNPFGDGSSAVRIVDILRNAIRLSLAEGLNA